MATKTTPKRKRVFTCRSCGAESAVWNGLEPCPHCGAPHVNRIEEGRVRAQLDALAVLYGNRRPTAGEVKRQLDLFRTESDT
jgi:predicted ATP-dependent serine protease